MGGEEAVRNQEAGGGAGGMDMDDLFSQFFGGGDPFGGGGRRGPGGGRRGPGGGGGQHFHFNRGGGGFGGFQDPFGEDEREPEKP